MVMVAVDDGDGGLVLVDRTEDEVAVQEIIDSMSEDELVKFEETDVDGSEDFNDERLEAINSMEEYKSNIDWYLEEEMHCPMDCRQVMSYADLIYKEAYALYNRMMVEAKEHPNTDE